MYRSTYTRYDSSRLLMRMRTPMDTSFELIPWTFTYGRSVGTCILVCLIKFKVHLSMPPGEEHALSLRCVPVAVDITRLRVSAHTGLSTEFAL